MKLHFALISLLTVTSTALSACGQAPVLRSSLPRMQSFQAAPSRQASGQLHYASEMRGFSSIQNPMRTMQVEFTSADGQKMRMHADRFLKAASFNIAVGPENSHQDTLYFSSADKAKVQTLVNTLKALDTQSVDTNNQAALGRILEHLTSAL